MKPVEESDGALQSPQPSTTLCPKCQHGNVTYQVWESSDGAYEDYKYTCPTCAHVWWVDGIDS